MAYTSLLGLVQPDTGTLSGTWGDTVNSYLTAYLDSAIAGAQTISGSQTSVTLSTANGSALSQAGAGATGSAQYAIINCTGNPAGMLTVTAPAASKVYLVINSTSTNQSVKVVGAGPTTGVTVAAGQVALIAWAGTDFKLVASTDASKLSGVLAVANGGTGLSTLTTGSVLVGNGSSAVGFVAPGTAGNVLTSNGTAWVSSASSFSLSANNAFTGANTFYNNTGQTFGTGTSTQDGLILAGRTGGSSSYRVTLQPTTLTANRTLTLPDNSGTVLTSGATVTVPQGGTGLTSGTSGGIPYFSASNTITSSATLAANALMIGGGVGVAPSTTTTGTGVITALGITPGTAGSFVVNGGALGTPSSATLTNATGLPISTGVTGLGTGVGTFLVTPSSANLAAAVTDETGSGALVFGTSPSLTTPALSGETFSTTGSITAGSNAQGQSPLTADYNIIATAPSAPSGVTLPAATTGRRIIIVNKGVNTVNVYPASGATIDALGVNNSIAVPANNVMSFNAATATQWYSSYNLYTSATAAAGVTTFSAGTTGLTPSTATSGAVTLAGTLAVANGGTGVTTSTGSGSVVLSTSPTLTTPNLGTPSAITLTNATGLPLSTGVTGSLPVSQGGTGQTSYTDGQLLIGNSLTGSLSKAGLTAGSGVSIVNGNGTITISATGSGGSVTSVGMTVPSFLTITGSPITTSGTLAVALSGTALPTSSGGTGLTSFTAANNALYTTSSTALAAGTLPVAAGGTGVTSGTSGGVLYFSGAGVLASSAALAASSLVIGGGAGVAPSTTTTGTGVLTALGVNVGSAGAFTTNNAANTFTAAQTFRAANSVRAEAAATQDAVVLAGRAGGTLSYAVTLTPTTLTASRTVTLPDASTTIPVATQVLTFSGPTAARTITLPDANFTAARTDAAQTFTGTQTVRAAATQDAVALAGRAGGTLSYAVTLTPTTLSASRTITLPNADINFTTGLGVAQGGTGTTSLTANNVLLGNGTSALQVVAPGASGNVLTSNGTTWVSSAATAPDVQTFNSTGTWNKPTGTYTMARIQVWGGGGGGGRSNSNNSAGGGGGGGYNEITVPLSYLAASVTATIGGGGAGATTNTDGVAGGTSSFALATAFMGRSTIEAYGGGGGGGSAAGGGGGGGGGQLSAGSAGGITVYGASGSPNTGSWMGGFGGFMKDVCAILTYQPAGSALFGGGGGAPTGQTAGTSVYGGVGGVNATGTAPGGGGGSSTGNNVNGSSGAAGRIVVTCW